MPRSVFNCVVAVVKHAIQTLMQIRHVITAVEIVIDEDFPVAIESVMTSLQPVQVCKIERVNLIDEVSSQKIPQRNRVVTADPGKHPVLPLVGLYRQQTICCLIKITDVGKIWCSFQRAFQ